MDAESSVAVQIPYWARPGRRAHVVTDLASLRGPVRGAIELPLRLYWSSEDRAFDLDEPYMRRGYDQIVLREACRPEDLTDYLDGDTLIGVWPDLHLPIGVRRTREEHHRVLQSAVAAVSA